MSIKEADYQEFFSKDPENPEKKRRYYNNRPVIVNMDEVYHKRLESFRKISKKFNKALEAELKKRQLPYSTKENHTEPIRLTFHFRPEFISTDYKTRTTEGEAGNRFNTSADEVAIFFHLAEDDKPDEQYFVRAYGNMSKTKIMLASFITQEKNKLKDVFDINDFNAIIQYVADQLEAQEHITKDLEQPEKIKDIEQAQKYFNEERIFGEFSYYDAPVLKNLIANTIRSILNHEIQKLLSQNKTTPKTAKEKIQSLVKQILSLPVDREQNSTTKSIILEAIEKTLEIRPEKVTSKKHTPENIYNAFINNLIKEASDTFRRKYYKPKK